MASQGPLDPSGLSLPAIIGILIVIVLCAFLLGFLTARLTNWIRSVYEQSTPHPSPSSSSMTEASKDLNDVDLEAGVAVNSSIPAGLKFNSSSTFPGLHQKKKRSLSISAQNLRHNINFSRASSDKKKNAQEKKNQISRPTRLLPADTSFVIVRSPLITNEKSFSTQTQMPSPKFKNNHDLTMSDKTLVNKSKNIVSKNIFCDELGRKIQAQEADQAVGTSSNHTPRKRTIIWYDDEILKTRSVTSSLRSLRSNSLPSSTTSSSREVISRSSINTNETFQSNWGDATINLGSSSQLWLSYQFQLAGG